jgi:hypothetical protein
MSNWVVLSGVATTNVQGELSVEIDVASPYRLVLRVPATEVVTVPARGVSELERGLVASILARGQVPAMGVEHRLACEVAEVGKKHVLVRVRTPRGPETVRVPLDAVLVGGDET